MKTEFITITVERADLTTGERTTIARKMTGTDLDLSLVPPGERLITCVNKLRKDLDRAEKQTTKQT